MSFYPRIGIALLFFLFFASQPLLSQVIALKNAHAHNDYKHKHPLQDAMQYGFTSIEADVFFKHDKFIVAHISPFLKRANLEELYLKPLSTIISKHPAVVYADYPQPVILLIDIKTDAEKTYKALKPLLEKYASALTHYENGKVIEGALTIILSGNKPYATIQKEPSRFAFIDENLLAADKLDKNVCPLTSARYSTILTWKGKGKIPAEEKQKLITLTTTAHAQGKKVRLWASPDNKIVWQELLENGVDLINTDDLKGLSDFLNKAQDSK